MGRYDDHPRALGILFRRIFSGRWAALSARATAGRELWINSCASCHHGPPGTAGGNESDRPFDVLVAHATHNSDYFKRYIRNPKGLVATAKMEPHPHYSASQLADLVASLRAE